MSPLPITCPFCGESVDAVQAVAEGEHREYLELLAAFGPTRPAVIAYLDLFRAAPGAAMRIATRLKLVRELARLWEMESFAFNRRTYQISRAQIAESLHDTVRAKRGPAPLSNHNYLKQVMLGKLDRTERQEKRQEARQEREREERRRAGVRDAAPPPPADAEAEGPAIWEGPLDGLAGMLAAAYRTPFLRGGLDWFGRVEERLTEAGIDLARLRAVAVETPPKENFGGRGPELLRRCKAGGAAPAPLAACLPLGLEQASTAPSPPEPAGHLVTPAQAEALAADMRRFCDISRELKADPFAGRDHPELAEVEERLSRAQALSADLVAIAWRGADQQMSDAELLARVGLKIGGQHES